ncbi:MAG: redox-sensing transcriptional repressor Rex [Spirochaetaceae bacterium]
MDSLLNQGIVLRLARYLRVLEQLKTLGFVKIFSNNLGDAIGVTPAVVRKDFSTLSIPGNKRGGYNVDVLISEISSILGRKEVQPVIVVGCGRIGGALMAYREFPKEGIQIAAGFDGDPDKLNRNGEIPILPTDELKPFVREHNIEVGILAVPNNQATAVFDMMLDAGIRGFLNFAAVELKCAGKCDKQNCPIRCTVHNVNIGLEIENLFYLVRMRKPDNISLTIDELKEKHADPSD